MGGFFGITSRSDCLPDVFFGVDYHSHLGTRRAGMAAYDPAIGLQRKIHKIENSPFRTKFEKVFEQMSGIACIGCISDYDPQPLMIRSRLGVYAVCVIGIINNSDEPCVPQIKSQYELPQNWYVIANDNETSDQALYRFEQDMLVPPRSALIIVDAESYDKINGTDFTTAKRKSDISTSDINEEILKMIQ